MEEYVKSLSVTNMGLCLQCDVPQCTNIWPDFQSREMSLFKVNLRYIEGCDLPQFDLTSLVLIFTGHKDSILQNA